MIPAGQAIASLGAALEDLVRAYQLVEGIGLAIARQLDAMAETPTEAP